MLLVFSGKKGTLMMIEPPGQPGRSAVLEVDNRVLVAVEKLQVEKLLGAVKQPGKDKLGGRRLLGAVEIGEKGRRASTVEAPIVKTADKTAVPS